MKPQLLILTATAVLAADNLLADDSNNSFQAESLRYDQDSASASASSSPSMYRGNEFSIAAFGTDAVSQHTIDHISGNRVRHDSTLGAGLGVNYFLLPFLGVGAEGYTENTAYHFVDDVSGSLIARIPIGQTGLAPYAYGGAGHKFDPVKLTFAHVGGGLEFRFTPHIGIFADARYVMPDKIRNYGLVRAGLTFAF